MTATKKYNSIKYLEIDNQGCNKDTRALNKITEYMNVSCTNIDIRLISMVFALVVTVTVTVTVTSTTVTVAVLVKC